MSLIIGIDPSITATGLVVLQNGDVETAKTTKNKPDLGVIERVALILAEINKIIEHPNLAPDLITIEGFSYGSKGKGLFQTAYLGYRIREELERYRLSEGIPWLEVSPSQLKLFATGKGNASKDIMLQQVYKRWGYETHDNNIADAYALARVGEAWLMPDITSLTMPQQKVILGLEDEQKPPKKARKKVKA